MYVKIHVYSMPVDSMQKEHKKKKATQPSNLYTYSTVHVVVHTCTYTLVYTVPDL